MFFCVFSKCRTETTQCTEKTGRFKIFVKRHKLWLIPVLAVLLLIISFACVKLFYIPDTAFCEGMGEYSVVAKGEKGVQEFFEQFGCEAEFVEKYQVTVAAHGKKYEEYIKLQQSHGLNPCFCDGERLWVYVMRLSCRSENGDRLFGVATIRKGHVAAVYLSDFRYPAQCYSLREIG